MGSDSSPLALLEGVSEAFAFLQGECKITVVASSRILEEVSRRAPYLCGLPAEEEIFMDESPLWAVRRKKGSSLAVGLRLLKEKHCDAFVTAGNTGALTACASFTLNRFKGIDRPALLALLPTEKGRMAIVDVGANVAFRPEHFLQVALMGAAYQNVLFGIDQPTVGLLNIGVEAGKGTQKIRQAFDYFMKYETVKNPGFSFRGNIESRDAFYGKVDVMVTEGFAGNIFLKTCEGVSGFILDRIQRHFLLKNQELQKEVFDALEKYLDYAEYPGAFLIGVESVVVKCHGCSNAQAVFSGIRGAHELVKKQAVRRIRSHVEKREIILPEE